jgi:DNA-binding transcriptional LysR family regulator
VPPADEFEVSLTQLRVFREVARRLSFTQAAAVLRRSQPAVSAMVRELERHLGVDLFEQVGRRVHLTEAGRAVLGAAERVFGSIEAMGALVAHLKGVRRGTLRVGAASTAGEYVVPPLLGAFHKAHPGIALSLVVDNRAGILRRLAENELDLAVMGRVPDGADLEGEPFLPNPLVVVAAAAHPLARRKRVPLDALREDTWLLREEGSGTRLAQERLFDERGFRARERLVLSSNSAVKQAAIAGLGIAVLPRAALDLELATRRLALLDVEGLPLERHWHVVWLRNKPLSPAAEAFADLLREAGRRGRR